MPLPDFHDDRPYTHPEHPGTWRISTVGPSSILMRNVASPALRDVQIADWPGSWQAHEQAATEIAPGIHPASTASPTSTTSTPSRPRAPTASTP